MKYTEIEISGLKTFDQCEAALERIEGDYLNIKGGLKAWISGDQTYLLKGAQKKVKAIERKQSSFPIYDEDW